MSQDLQNLLPWQPEKIDAPEETLAERFMDWVRTELVWYAGSFTFHLLGLLMLLLLGNVTTKVIIGDAPSFEEVKVDAAQETAPLPLEKFELGDAPEDPAELNDETLPLAQPNTIAQAEEHNDDSKQFEHRGGGTPDASRNPSLGGLGGFDVIGPAAGAKVNGKGGVGTGLGTGIHAGSGGAGFGFGQRGSGSRKEMLGRYGGTKQSEVAVARALSWFHRHQHIDGSWSLQIDDRLCSDKTCTGSGSIQANAGATALGLLPFLAAGQTHKTKGQYRETVHKGLMWLVSHQGANGNLANLESHSSHFMYSHGLATIAMCEAYGLSGDKALLGPAQRAVLFILAAQNQKDFGWRYNAPQVTPSDTSVTGWQVMALKSAQMAGIDVGGSNLESAGKFLDSVKSGPNGSRFGYLAGYSPTQTLTAVGLLCRQYLYAKRTDPMMVDGEKYLMENMPSPDRRNVYYWYYATQVLHNYSGADWDIWNRAMRKLLIETQVKQGCATGSWSPDKPAMDTYGGQGGRHYVTSLSCLTLEIYYRYLPLYKVGDQSPGAAAAPPAEATPTSSHSRQSAK